MVICVVDQGSQGSLDVEILNAAESPLQALRILLHRLTLIDNVGTAVRNHESLLSQGNHCPPDILESSRLEVVKASRILWQYEKDNPQCRPPF